jgi:seryl-tRNA synthetase
LVTEKKALDAQVEAKRKEAKELETKMRKIASNVGNIVAKDVPVSQTEVIPNAACHRSFRPDNVHRMIMLHYGHGIPGTNLKSLPQEREF